MSNTPICDFVKKYAQSSFSRFHMPGHKGKNILGCEKFDITEIVGADSLFKANGIIAESEKNAGKLFGSFKTLYSAEGSSQCIRAMLYLSTLNSGKQKPLLVATRNAHKVFALTAALLDFDVVWLNNESDGKTLCSCNVSSQGLENTLKSLDRAPAAVYVTSPDYLGSTLNLTELSKSAHKYGTILICDNAHGAYLKFTGNDHPMDCGVDMCCDSAHKTLPVLTGGAYLHIGKKAPQYLAENAKDAMAMFCSTSPSYLILQSLDNFNGMISQGYGDKIKQAAANTEKLKREIRNCGWTLLQDTEPFKITFKTKENGYRGEDFAKILYNYGIMTEYADPDYVVLMISAENGKRDYEKLINALKSVPQKPKITNFADIPAKTEKVMTMKDALTAPSEYVQTNLSLNRVLACPTVSCPPAIPVLYGGERITAEAVTLLNYYGIDKVKVVIE